MGPPLSRPPRQLCCICLHPLSLVLLCPCLTPNLVPCLSPSRPSSDLNFSPPSREPSLSFVGWDSVEAQVTKPVRRRCWLDAGRVPQAQEVFADSEPPCPSRLCSLAVPLSVLPLILLTISGFFHACLPSCLGQLHSRGPTALPPGLLCQQLALPFLSQGLGPWDGAHGRRGPGIVPPCACGLPSALAR